MDTDKDIEFSYKNLTCCSMELYWKVRMKENKEEKEKDKNNLYEYKLKLKRETLYIGQGTTFTIKDLSPNETYSFTLYIKKGRGDFSIKKELKVTTLNPPIAILSENSDKVANGEKLNFKEKVSESYMRIINNCKKLIFEKNDEEFIVGDFCGIEIRIVNEICDNINISYISFDITSDYLQQFFEQFYEQSQKNAKIPCHFIIQKLPTIFIFNLLEKGPVILTGKRMGGQLAASLAFNILSLWKKKNINYGNAFIKNEKKCIGVVTFGSPIFLYNLTSGIKMKEFASYFVNIKDEFDFIPKLIDFTSEIVDFKGLGKYKLFLNIFKKETLNDEEFDLLKRYLAKRKKDISNIYKYYSKYYSKIPFGYYLIMENKGFSLITVNENTFNNFYYCITDESIKSISKDMLYKKLSLNFEIKFDNISLNYLRDKGQQLELIKIIRRKTENSESSSGKMKGILKIQLEENNYNIFSPDIIKKIILTSQS